MPEAATETAVREGLSFCLVTEDTTRAHPDTLRTLFRVAIDAGATRLCLCDTTGHVTPYGVEELVAFARRQRQILPGFLAQIEFLAPGRELVGPDLNSEKVGARVRRREAPVPAVIGVELHRLAPPVAGGLWPP